MPRSETIPPCTVTPEAIAAFRREKPHLGRWTDEQVVLHLTDLARYKAYLQLNRTKSA